MAETTSKPDATATLLPEDVLPEIYNRRTAPKRRYLVGIRQTSPPVCWNHSIAGINFPVYTESFDVEGNASRRRGAIYELTVEQCKLIREELRNRIVRWHVYGPGHNKEGEKHEATIWDVRSRMFVPMEKDEPLVRYVLFQDAPVETQNQKEAPSGAFADLDAAILAAEKSAAQTETVKASDPEDQVRRQVHGAFRKAGKGLDAAEGSV